MAAQLENAKIDHDDMKVLHDPFEMDIISVECISITIFLGSSREFDGTQVGRRKNSQNMSLLCPRFHYQTAQG